MYIANARYSLKTIKHTKIDRKFIEISYLYQKKFPGKWHYFASKIINNKEICYFRDTTGIFNVNLIEFSELQNLFEILKIYLNNHIINKLIYKKEFIIIHFNKDFHVEFIKNSMYLLSINLFKYFEINYNGLLDVYFGAVLTIGNIKQTIEMVVLKDSFIYLFESKNILDIALDEKIKKVYIYEFISSSVKLREDVFDLKLAFSESEYINKIDALFRNNEKSQLSDI